MKKERSTRTSFSLPPRLLLELDEATQTLGYQERSKTIQMAIKNLIAESRRSTDGDALAVGTIIVLYDHNKKGVDEKLNDVGHDFISSVISSLHVHLSRDRCFSVIVAKDTMKTLLELGQRVRGIAGITQVRLSYVVPSLEGT